MLQARDLGTFDTEALAATAEGFSGAEIEAAVTGAILDAFTDGCRGLTTAGIERSVRSIRPTSEVKREEIADLRRWAQDHLAIDAVRGQPVGGERFLEF